MNLLLVATRLLIANFLNYESTYRNNSNNPSSRVVSRWVYFVRYLHNGYDRMKTEMEQLEENTHIEKAKQTANALSKYYMELLEDTIVKIDWTLRSSSMLMFTFVMHFAVLFLMLWLDMSDTFISVISELFTVLMLVGIFRNFYHENRLASTRGELEGCEETLRVLGYLPPKGTKKRKVHLQKSPYERFKEFFERVGKKQSKEAHA